MVMARGGESHNHHQQFSALTTTDFDRTMFDFNLQRPEIAPQNHFNGLLKQKHCLPRKNFSLPTENGFLKAPHCSVPCGVYARDKSIDEASNPPQRKFLIFDRSENITRLYYSHQISLQNETFASNCEKVPTGADPQRLMDPLLEEKWDENHITDEEGEIHEDTEELNALLYSDSDDEYEDDYDEEVTSRMALGPFGNEEISEKDQVIENFSSCEEASSKRQRLLNGKYKKSSPSSSSSATCSENLTMGARELTPTTQESKVRVREALKILKTIIPGSNSKDPLSIIDDAIAYLKAMKTEAEALGFSQPSAC